MASAELLASEGANLYLTARDGEELTRVADNLRNVHGANVGIFPADLTEVESAENIISAAIEQYGQIDILINCAGASQGGIFWKIPDKVWLDSLDLKFMGTLRAIRAVIPTMRERRYGRIVSVIGNTGKQPDSRLLPGAAANAALLAVTKGLADEVAGDGIVINAVNPGPTRTHRWNTLISNLAITSGRTIAEVENKFLKKIPMNRLGEPSEIARLIIFLASDAAANITGTSITADGGWTQAIA